MAKSKKKVVSAPAKKTITWGKPPGRVGQFRAEDIKPYTVIEIEWTPEDKEIHLALPNQYDMKAMVHTLLLSKNGKDCCVAATLPAYVDWDYTMKPIKDVTVRMEVIDGKMIYKIAKKKVKADVAEAQTQMTNESQKPGIVAQLAEQ